MTYLNVVGAALSKVTEGESRGDYFDYILSCTYFQFPLSLQTAFSSISISSSLGPPGPAHLDSRPIPSKETSFESRDQNFGQCSRFFHSNQSSDRGRVRLSSLRHFWAFGTERMSRSRPVGFDFDRVGPFGTGQNKITSPTFYVYFLQLYKYCDPPSL